MASDIDVVRIARQIFPNLKELEKDLAGQSGVLADRGIVTGTGDETERQKSELTEVLAEGREGIKKVREGAEDTLTKSEKDGIEAIIHLIGRPALLIQNGIFFPPPAEWQVLNDHADGLNSTIQKVGRIEVTGHPSYDWIGTGFLVGVQTVMTNRHVAVEFASNSGGTWNFIPRRSSRLDFIEELGATISNEFKVIEIIGIHDELDLALLRIEAASASGQPLPQPLEVAATQPDPIEERNVYVVGYPAWDGRRNDPEPMRRIFSDIYNVKRLQPGKIRSLAPQAKEFVHDCSTLGGNSGSPVFDLVSQHVLGLHFGGRYLEGNHAVALWMLTDDALLRAGKVNFV